MLKNGFTLIELIVVIAIIGMASALALPLISNSFDRLRLNSASRQIAGVLRETRSQAISEKKTLGFNLDFSTSKYSVTKMEEEIPLTVSTGEIPQNVTLKGFSYTNAKKLNNDGIFSVSFFSQGNSTGGNFDLGSIDNKDNFSITIDKISGRTRIKAIEED